MNVLTTSGFRLEPLVSEHAKEMYVVLSDPAIYEFENAPPESEAWLTDRYRRLESRKSPDGQALWLNWVIRLPSGELAGYVQATVLDSRVAHLAYELNSRYWRRGIGSAAVELMMRELSAEYSVRTFVAVLKVANYRSMALLRRLAFRLGDVGDAEKHGAGADECVMIRNGPFEGRSSRSTRIGDEA